jgi:predicted AlkP superfamily phosphohydrolase/phosphomutase
MVIGLDCAGPELVFGRWLNDLPNIPLKKYPAAPTRLDELEIDWSRTKAWGGGSRCREELCSTRWRERCSDEIEKREFEGP